MRHFKTCTCIKSTRHAHAGSTYYAPGMYETRMLIPSSSLCKFKESLMAVLLVLTINLTQPRITLFMRSYVNQVGC